MPLFSVLGICPKKETYFFCNPFLETEKQKKQGRKMMSFLEAAKKEPHGLNFF